MKKRSIRPLVLCVFRHQGRILVACLHDRQKNEDFYRPLGGGVKFGESAEKAVRREIREELGCEIIGINLLGVLENRFTYNGKACHEILFIYDAKFKDDSFYKMKHVPAHEGEDRQIKTKWIDPFKKYHRTPLYPEGLKELLESYIKKGG